MVQLNRSERLALLVTLLGDDAKRLARQGLQGGSLERLEQALKDFEEFPPTSEEIDIVVSDFEESFQLALAGADMSAADSAANGPQILQLPEEHFEVELEPERKFEPIKLTGNSIADLNLLHPYQVASALQGEAPEIVSIVCRKLTQKHAAKTIECLPEVMRAKVILCLSRAMEPKSKILDLVVEKILESAMQVEQRKPQEASAQQMADLLRSFPKPIRLPLFTALEEDNPDLAEQVKKLLYRMEDLLNLADRDMQMLLGQCSSGALVVALQGCEEALLSKIFSNMSKRAKEALQEEMEFAPDAGEDEVQISRDEILKTMIELDESGKITVE